MSVWVHRIPQQVTITLGCTGHLGEAHHVDATSATNVWIAVGNPAGTPGSQLANDVNLYQWTGTAYVPHHYHWSGSGHVGAHGLLVFGTADVWLWNGQSIAHWNGTVWTDVYLPPTPGNGVLAGNATNDIWFTSQASDLLDGHVLTAHWNGSSWLITDPIALGFTHYKAGSGSSTSVDGFNNRAGPLGFVTTTGAFYALMNNTVTGVDYRTARPTGGSPHSTQTFSLDGFIETFWKQSNTVGWALGSRIRHELDGYSVPSIWTGAIGSGWGEIASPPYYDGITPDPTLYGIHMYGIGGTGTNDYTICGEFTNGTYTLVIDRYLSGTWIHYDIAGFSGGGSGVHGLFSVKALAGNDVWVVGAYYCLADNKTHTLVEHWNGTVWTERAIPLTI